jgi:hypothetical protein
VDRSVGRWVSQLVSWSVGQLVSWSVDQSVSWSVDQLVGNYSARLQTRLTRLSLGAPKARGPSSLGGPQDSGVPNARKGPKRDPQGPHNKGWDPNIRGLQSSDVPQGLGVPLFGGPQGLGSQRPGGPQGLGASMFRAS